MSAAAPRVISLVPSVTETLLAWGVSPVACTRFCEQPDLPHVGGTKDPDVRAIVELRPDLVVMCVEENRREDADALAQASVPTVALSIDAVSDVAPALRMLAGLVGVHPGRVEESVTDPPGARVDRPLRAFVPTWKRPWMSLAGGTYGSSLLEAIGVENVFADAAERYPEITLDDARARRPDVVLAPSEPYP
ncbi:MAG TPA: helical backbone metal receptor, partial [Acidimicrobiales bacterium]|nr:helical backbone metal receptor [Acidimicrobiales bacterium]